MIQSIYTSTSNADIVPCGKKGTIVKSDPIPLLRDNYLGEYRTELERAKVRKNLGISDDQSLIWGSIDGTIEEQKDLVTYIELKWKYTYSGISLDINNVKEALDYALYFISRYESNDQAIIDLTKKVTDLLLLISEIESELTEEIQTNSDNITNILQSITVINNELGSLNDRITNIDVDLNILNWITTSLTNSSSIQLLDNTLEVKISSSENNAINILDGLFVTDHTLEISNIQDKITNLEQLEDAYNTELSDDTNAVYLVGGINQSTTVKDLRGKSFSDIIDTILFPTVVRDLVYPSISFTNLLDLVEVGTPATLVEINFYKGDAGNETSRLILIDGNPTDLVTAYNRLGSYEYTAMLTYEAGEYLIDNKGNVTDKRIEAGSVSTSHILTTTYPWYSGNTNLLIKLSLVPFNLSVSIEISLSEKAIIKLPGINSLLTKFKVNGGLGFLDVDMNGWEQTTELINNYMYRVWTKKNTYSAILPHLLEFKLSL